MLTTGTVTSPIGHTRGVPLPGTVAIRPVQRRNTSPFTTTAPSQPDPDAIARLERLGVVVVRDEVVDEKPVKVVTRGKGKRKTPKPANAFPRSTPLRRLDLDPTLLAAEYEAGATVAELAAKHSASTATINARLRAAGAQLRNRARRVQVSTERLIQLHEQGLTHKQIAAEVGLSVDTVGTRLRVRGIRGASVNTGAANAPRRDLTSDLLAADYRAGLSINEIAAKHHVSGVTVRRRLSKIPDLPNHRGGRNRTPEDVQAAIIRDYESGLNAKQVADRLGMSHRTVYGVLRRSGVDMRPAGVAHRGHPGVDGASGLKELMRSNGITAADVRAWAAAAGRDVTARGLPSRRLVEDYLLNHPKHNLERRHP